MYMMNINIHNYILYQQIFSPIVYSSSDSIASDNMEQLDDEQPVPNDDIDPLIGSLDAIISGSLVDDEQPEPNNDIDPSMVSLYAILSGSLVDDEQPVPNDDTDPLVASDNEELVDDEQPVPNDDTDPLVASDNEEQLDDEQPVPNDDTDPSVGSSDAIQSEFLVDEEFAQIDYENITFDNTVPSVGSSDAIQSRYIVDEEFAPTDDENTVPEPNDDTDLSVGSLDAIQSGSLVDEEFSLTESEQLHVPSLYCPICSMPFTDEISLNDHCDLAHNLATMMHDPTSFIIGQYHCPVCLRRFLTEPHLNQHFNARHMNYDDMVAVSNKKTSKLGFPGFNLLELAGMVMKVEQTTDHHHAVCSICRNKYIMNSDTHPYRMRCCSNLICQSCCQKSVQYSDKIVCSYCLHDHEYNHPSGSYLIIYTFNRTNDSWKEWWNNKPNLLERIMEIDPELYL